MHEMSYVTKLVNKALSAAEREKLGGNIKLFVKIGKMTGIEPYYMNKYYEIAVKDTPLKGSVLEIESIEVKAVCADCGEKYSPNASNNYSCPSCGSANGKIVEGREFVLDKIVSETE